MGRASRLIYWWAIVWCEARPRLIHMVGHWMRRLLLSRWLVFLTYLNGGVPFASFHKQCCQVHLQTIRYRISNNFVLEIDLKDRPYPSKLGKRTRTTTAAFDNNYLLIRLKQTSSHIAICWGGCANVLVVWNSNSLLNTLHQYSASIDQLFSFPGHKSSLSWHLAHPVLNLAGCIDCFLPISKSSKTGARKGYCLLYLWRLMPCIDRP